MMLAACAVILLDARPSIAQAQDAEGRLVYDRAFFDTFSPSNAQQMVERLPGFVLEGGDTEVRGFGQAAGNVIINGQRPSSKSETLQTVLARIPASRVLRIEISSGNAFGSDYAGKPQVANVILTEEGGLAGNFDARLSREFTGRLLPRGSASAVLRTGASTFNGSISFQKFSLTDRGHDEIVDMPDSGTTLRREVFNRNTEPYTTASLGWAHEEAADRSIHVNGRVTSDKWTIHQPSTLHANGSHIEDGLYTEDHLWHTWELSGDITRPLAGGAIKLNLLATHRHRRNDDYFFVVPLENATPTTGLYSKFDDWRAERVGRLAWTRTTGGWALELGMEGAYNRLRSDLNLYELAGDDRTRVDLPIDQAVVEEYRGEAFVNAGRNLASNLRLDLGLNYEASRLIVSGDATARRVLHYWKPKVSLDWTSGGWHTQLSVKHSVAQLNFSDFVSAASLNTAQIDGGNEELVPQRKWELLLSADRTLLGDGRIKLEVGHQRVTQVQDRVPIRDKTTGEIEFDAPGNLGDGTQWIARANLDLPLSRLAGIKGGRLSFSGSYLGTSVEDPYTLLDRPFSGTSRFTYTVDFRQDLGVFAWGVGLSGNSGSTFYRLAETDNSQAISPKVNAFAEYRPSTRSTLTLGIENVTNGGSKRWRYFYTPDRTSATPSRREYRERSSHALVYLSIKHSFG